MPWLEVDEPFSAGPRSVGPMTAPGDAAVIDVDDRWGSILEAELTGTVDVSGCERLELRGSVLRGVSFVAQPGVELDITNCDFIECDLSAVRLATVTNSRFEGCKLSGVDLGSAILRDIDFERTLLRMTTCRMAQLERVAFRACTLDDVDFYEAVLTDVAFPESDLREVEMDKVRFSAVDLRGAGELDLRSCRRFDGALLEAAQIAPLAQLFAHAAGVQIEKPDD